MNNFRSFKWWDSLACAKDDIEDAAKHLKSWSDGKHNEPVVIRVVQYPFTKVDPNGAWYCAKGVAQAHKDARQPRADVCMVNLNNKEQTNKQTKRVSATFRWESLTHTTLSLSHTHTHTHHSPSLALLSALTILILKAYGHTHHFLSHSLSPLQLNQKFIIGLTPHPGVAMPPKPTAQFKKMIANVVETKLSPIRKQAGSRSPKQTKILRISVTENHFLLIIRSATAPLPICVFELRWLVISHLGKKQHCTEQKNDMIGWVNIYQRKQSNK